jgi:hypothetical protein
VDYRVAALGCEAVWDCPRLASAYSPTQSRSRRENLLLERRCHEMTTTPTIDAPPSAVSRFEYLVVPLKEAKNLK